MTRCPHHGAQRLDRVELQPREVVEAVQQHRCGAPQRGRAAQRVERARRLPLGADAARVAAAPGHGGSPRTAPPSSRACGACPGSAAAQASSAPRRRAGLTRSTSSSPTSAARERTTPAVGGACGGVRWPVSGRPPPGRPPMPERPPRRHARASAQHRGERPFAGQPAKRARGGAGAAEHLGEQALKAHHAGSRSLGAELVLAQLQPIALHVGVGGHDQQRPLATRAVGGERVHHHSGLPGVGGSGDQHDRHGRLWWRTRPTPPSRPAGRRSLHATEPHDWRPWSPHVQR